MDATLVDLTRAIVALFIIMDPVGNIPIFIGLTSEMERAQRAKAYKSR